MATTWFAVRTRARAEKVVQEQLRRKHIEPFLPTIRRWSHWKDRRKAIDWPLFPGYCFARVEPDDTAQVLACHGVAGIVSFAHQPAPIPDYEIESVRRLVCSALQFDPAPFVREGDLVEVTHGPLLGCVGRLLRKHPPARLIVSVDLLGRSLSVAIDAADVRRFP